MGLRIAACIGWLSLVAAPVLTGACSADVAGTKQSDATGGVSSTGGSGSTGGSVATQACTDGLGLAHARIWRLSDDQYVNAVRQLFGVIAGPHITAVEAVAEFTNLSELSLVNSSTVVAYQTAAKDIARQ